MRLYNYYNSIKVRVRDIISNNLKKENQITGRDHEIKIIIKDFDNNNTLFNTALNQFNKLINKLNRQYKSFKKEYEKEVKQCEILKQNYKWT